MKIIVQVSYSNKEMPCYFYLKIKCNYVYVCILPFVDNTVLIEELQEDVNCKLEI